MWIKTSRGGTSRLYDGEIGVEVSFSENGTAQVEKSVGEQLIEKYDAISEHNNE